MSSSVLYYVYVALASFGMATTFTSYAPYLQTIGLSLGEISLLNAGFWTILIAMELPTGMLADGKSRAWSMKMGLLFQAAGSLSYIFAHGFLSALVGEGLIGVGMAFLSGADTAWITDALSREGREAERRYVFAIATMIRGVTTILGGFVGSLIALLNIRLIWLPMVPLALVGAWGVSVFMNGKGEPTHRMSEREALRASIRLLKQNTSLRWVIMSVVFMGTVISFNHYWSPYFKPQVGTLGLSWVWALMYLGVVVAGVWVRRLTIGQGNETAMILCAMGVTSVGMMVAGSIPGLVFPLAGVVLHEFGRGMFVPLVDSFVQHRVESGYRATFGSLQSFIGRLGFAIMPVFVWLTIRHDPDTSETIQFVWCFCGLLLGLGILLQWLFRQK